MTAQTASLSAASQRPVTKASKLRALLTSPDLEFLMEAHNGLSARVVEETGFKGIWASGLSMSAAMGVRDNNEASSTQVLEVLEFMSDCTTIPILVDGDTGWGNFNNMRRAVSKLCQREVAGICIEDKLFPKTNSFLGNGQPLADIHEFCGKIKAGKDSQTDPEFNIIARVEALISGLGMEEALRRAEAYHDAGADAILIHSKQSTSDEIMEFARHWDNRCPVVIVPTKYPNTPTDDFRDARISLAIWANHNMRAAVTAIRETSRQIFRDESIAGVDKGMVKVSEIFELTGNAELEQAEKKYLPGPETTRRAVVLAASRGEALGELTKDKPKCMIDVRGEPLLGRLTSTLKNSGVGEVTVVRGYQKEKINLPSIKTVDNDLYANTGEVGSLACARDQISGDCVIAYGDVLFRQYYLDQLFDMDADITIAVDALWRQRTSGADDWVRDFVSASKGSSGEYLDDEPVIMTAMGPDLKEGDIDGEWIGLVSLSARGSDIVLAEIDALSGEGKLQSASMTDLLHRLANNGHDIRIHYVPGQWLDVDDATDLIAAGRFL